jgi:FtsP/CotA-like multicopper oxidase with cupredoxin domain
VNYHPIPYDLNSSVYDYGPDIDRMNAQAEPVLYVPAVTTDPGVSTFSYTGTHQVGSAITKADHYPAPYIKMRTSVPGQPAYKEFWRIGNFGGDSVVNIQVLVNGVPQPLKVVEIDGGPASSDNGGEPGSTLTVDSHGDTLTHFQLASGNRVGIIVTAPAVAAGGAVPTMELQTSAYNSNGDADPARPLVKVVLDSTQTVDLPSLTVPSEATSVPDQTFAQLATLDPVTVSTALINSCGAITSQTSCQNAGSCTWIAMSNTVGTCMANGTNHTVFFGETTTNNSLTGGNPDFWLGADLEALGQGNTDTQDTIPGGNFAASSSWDADGGVQTSNLRFTFDVTKLPIAVISKQGTVEEWTIENHTNESHDFHIHQIHYMVESTENFSSAADNNTDPITGKDENQLLIGQMYDAILIPGWNECPTSTPAAGCIPCEPAQAAELTARANAPVGTFSAAEKADACAMDFAHNHIPQKDGSGKPKYPRVKVKMDFRGADGVNGLLVIHCHILGHEDYGMIRLMAIKP